jgi:hypothetical protein
MRKALFPIKKLQLLHLQNLHHTDSKIANILNVTSARVCQLRKRFGIPVFTVGRDNYQRNKFIYTVFKESNVSKKELSRKNNLSYKTIIRIIK